MANAQHHSKDARPRSVCHFRRLIRSRLISSFIFRMTLLHKNRNRVSVMIRQPEAALVPALGHGCDRFFRREHRSQLTQLAAAAQSKFNAYSCGGDVEAEDGNR